MNKKIKEKCKGCDGSGIIKARIQDLQADFYICYICNEREVKNEE